TTDGADSWSLFDTNGLGPFVLFQILVNPTDPDTYFAASQEGVFSYHRTVRAGGPSIDRVNPPAAKPGTEVSIDGNNFGPTQGNSTVTFGNTDAGKTTSWSNKSVRIRVPSGASTSDVGVSVASIGSNEIGFVIPAVSGRII